MAEPSFGSRAQLAWEKFATVKDCCVVHQALFGEKSPTISLAATLPALDEEWERLRGMPPESPEALAHLAKLEGQIQGAETAALKGDASISTAAFRQSFAETKADFEAIVHYVQLLAGKLTESTDRRDRFEFLSTRLLSAPTAWGVKEMHNRSAIEPVLVAITLGRSAKLDRKAAAARHFQETTERTKSLESVDEFFDGGLLLDLRGYKLSMGGDLLDPDVLYYTCALNVAIANRIDGLMKAEGREPADLARRYAQLDAKLKEIFQEQRRFAVPEAQKFEQPVKKAVARKPSSWAAPAELAPSGSSGVTWTLAGLGVLLLAALGISLMWKPPEPPFVQLSAVETAAISPVLSKAARAEVEGGIRLDCELSLDWASLSAEEKGVVVADFTQRMHELGIDTGTVRVAGGRVAFTFAGGKDIVKINS